MWKCRIMALQLPVLLCLFSLILGEISTEVDNEFLDSREISGQDVCARDPPSEEYAMPQGSECLRLCSSSGRCAHFNYLTYKKICQIYFFLPSIYEVIPNCKGSTNRREMIAPDSVAALVGTDIRFNCRRRSPFLHWLHKGVGSTDAEIVAKNCQVVPSFAARYSVESFSNNCNLLINNVQLKDAGTFFCKDQFSVEDTVSAQLYVEDSFPQCSTNSATGVVNHGDTLGLSCTLNYSGNCLPFQSVKFSWFNANGAVVTNAVTTGTANQITSSFSVSSPYPSVTPFTCVVNGAASAKDRRSCQTPAVEVCPRYLKTGSSGFRAILQPQTWSSAVVACQNLCPGCHLAVISSSAEQQAANAYLAQIYPTPVKGPCYTVNWNSFWTSGQRLNENSDPYVYEWRPTGGKNCTLPFSYTNWYQSAPAPYFGHCMSIHQYTGYQWLVGPCSAAYCALCEVGTL